MMSRIRASLALLLLPIALGTARGEGTSASDAPSSASGDQPCECVTAGDPNVACTMWQRTWGQVGLLGYPTGTKMGPNGVTFDPFFTLDLNLNVALTDDRSWYLFTESRFWTQKPGQNVTNSGQGSLDFSKRELDFDGGVAWNYTGPWEARTFLYSFNNLNRGVSEVHPTGYDDGFALENRYYLDSTNFDKGLYRFLSLGYYFTKSMIGADGVQFSPSLFARANVALDIVPERFYLYSDVQFITEKPITAKMLLADVGVAIRPFTNIRDLEFRIGADNTYDMQVGNLRTLFYGNVRIVW